MQCLQYQIKLLFLTRSGSSLFGDRECSQVTIALFGRPVILEDRVESTDNIDSDIVHRLYRGEKWWFWRGLEGSPLSGAYLSISIDFKRYRLSLSFIVGHTGMGVDHIIQNLNQLRRLQDRLLNEADTANFETLRELDTLSSETMAMYRQLADQVRMMKRQPNAQLPNNSTHINRVARQLMESIRSYRGLESAFRKKAQEQVARQYRLLRPGAAEAE